MATSRPLFNQAITGYSADEFRPLIDAAYPSPGVIRGGLYVTPNSPVGMSVLVSPGYAVVPAKSAANGKYLGEVTSAHVVTIAAAAAQPRIDIIVMQVTDTAFADASDQCVPVAIAGTPNTTPVAPAVPAGSLLLATVAVGAGVSSITSANITDNRVSAAHAVYATEAARDAANPHPTIGATCYLASVGGAPALEVFNGTTWDRYTPDLSSWTGPVFAGAAYDPNKPVRKLFGHITGTTDTSGRLAAIAMPAGTTSILGGNPSMSGSGGYFPYLRIADSTVSSLVMQLRTSVGAGVSSALVYDVYYEIYYQI